MKSTFSPTPNSHSPNPYYGWCIIWTLAITQTIGYGVLTYVFSVFVKPMEAEFNWTRTQMSTAFSLALLCAGLVAIPVGRFVDKRGARLVMSAGAVLGTLLILAWSWVQTLPMFYLVMSLLGLAIATTLYDVAFTVVAVWFQRERTRAMLIITLIAGLASTIFIPLATFLNETLGWRDALRVLALLYALTIPLHALVIRRGPRDLGLDVDGYAEAKSQSSSATPTTDAATLRSWLFWYLLLAVTFVRLAVSVLTAYLVPLLTERGYTPALVATAAGSIGLLQLVGRIFFAPLRRGFSLAKLSAFMFALHGVGLMFLLFIPNTLGLWLFVICYGSSNGAITLARAALLADVFGSKHYGQLNGIISFSVAMTGAVGPLVAGALHERSGNYSSTLVLLIVVVFVSAFLVARVSSKGSS
ncbi:MAG: MFS transporter [Trueperaceae bacterium]